MSFSGGKTLPALLLLLGLAASATADSVRLTPTDGARFALTLADDLGGGWHEVHVARIAVLSGRALTTIDPATLPAAASLELRLPTLGCSLVIADLGPAAERGRADAWQQVTHSAKIVACRSGDLERRRAAGAHLMRKVGSRIELRPLFNPATLVPGSDLALRLYFEGASVSGAVVSATHPDGSSSRAVSDGTGIATLRLPAAGAWTLTFNHAGATAELMFEILE